MSYKVLARKWRPQHFNDMLGQEPVLRALVNALDSNRLHHAYLFTGMRGVGKTSIARIFAKCLNCETNGVSSDPCGTCSACQDIDAGRFFDLIEVDAASRTKVEGTRELLENVPYAPASGRYKVYLIDEVHMFSTHSFNALLKTLEEPPEHVKFLLATTDPQKVPATVLSRCLQFNLKRMSSGILTQYLSKLLTEEKIEHEMPALDLIARASEGSVRDSLSLVEQAAAGGEGVIRAAEVESMLGRASVERLLSLIETLAQGDMPALFEQVDELAEYAPEFSELLGELLSLLHRIALLHTVPDSVTDTTPGYERLVALAGSLDPDEVQLFYQIGLHARRDMAFAPDTREAFDMALLRMHTFKPQQNTIAATAPLVPAAPTEAGSQGGSKGASSAASAASLSPVPKVDASNSATNAGVAPTESASAATATGLPIRGSVSAGGASMRAAALAAARGEALPPEVAAQVAALSGQPAVADPPPANNDKHTSEPTAPEPHAAQAPQSVTAAPAQSPVRTSPASQATADPAPLQSAPATVEATTQEQPAQNAANDHADDPSTKAVEKAQPTTLATPVDKSALTAADWPGLVAELDIAGMPLQLATNCVWFGIQNDQLKLQLHESSEHLHKPQFLERLQSAIASWYGRDIQVSVDLVAHELQTPAKITEKQAEDDLAAAHHSIKGDPIVQQLIEKVDAAVDESSIRPVQRQ